MPRALVNMPAALWLGATALAQAVAAVAATAWALPHFSLHLPPPLVLLGVIGVLAVRLLIRALKLALLLAAPLLLYLLHQH